MNDERNPDDAALDAALGELPVPELSAELRQRLEAIPARGTVRRFPVRSFRVSALGWAAAAALGLFIGAHSLEEADSGDVAALGAESSGANVDTAAEDESLALAVGSFAEFEEEP